MKYQHETEGDSEDDDDAYKGQKFDLIGYQDYLPISLQTIRSVASSIKGLVAGKEKPKTSRALNQEVTEIYMDS